MQRNKLLRNGSIWVILEFHWFIQCHDGLTSQHTKFYRQGSKGTTVDLSASNSIYCRPLVSYSAFTCRGLFCAFFLQRLGTSLQDKDYLVPYFVLLSLEILLWKWAVPQMDSCGFSDHSPLYCCWNCCSFRTHECIVSYGMLCAVFCRIPARIQ